MGFTHLISSFLDFFDGNETTEKDTPAIALTDGAVIQAVPADVRALAAAEQAAPADADKNQKSPLTVLSYCKGAFLMGLQDTANSFHKDRGIKSHPKNTPQRHHPISPKDRAPDDRHQKRRQAIQRMEVLHLHDGQARHGNEKTADNRDFYHHHVRDEASQQ